MEEEERGGEGGNGRTREEKRERGTRNKKTKCGGCEVIVKEEMVRG